MRKTLIFIISVLGFLACNGQQFRAVTKYPIVFPSIIGGNESRLYFINNEDYTWVPYSTDGTDTNCHPLTDISSGLKITNVVESCFLYGEFYFAGSEYLHYTTALFATGNNGQEAVLEKNMDWCVKYPSYASLYNLTPFANGFLFLVSDNIKGNSLWVSDGTNTGTSEIKLIDTGYAPSYTSGFLTYNGRLYFGVYDGYKNIINLWATDGTRPGTAIVKTIGAGGYYLPYGFIVWNGNMFFAAGDSMQGYELWETDGTDTGTRQVKDIWQGKRGSNPRYFTILNEKLYFIANDSAHGAALWATDGTAAGTQLVKGLHSRDSTALNGGSGVYNNKMYFGLADDDGSHSLWCSDGTDTGTRILKMIDAAGYGALPQYFTEMRWKLYFRAGDILYGDELWETDGTAAGTKMVKPPTYVQSPLRITTGLTLFKGSIYYVAAYDTSDFGENRFQIWSYTDTINASIPGEINHYTFKTYPNPVTENELHIQLSQPIEGNAELQLQSMEGKEVAGGQWSVAGNSTFNLPIPANIANGLYILTVRTKEEVYSGKVVVGR